jgi:hypothetical protein
MFVRFRQSDRRLQVSVVETRRTDGKVRHEHIAGLGSVDIPPSVRERLVFWGRLPDRLARLGNRVNAADQAKIYGAIHGRVPMVTIEEQQALKLDNAEADERFWSGLHGAHQEQADGQKQLAAKAERAAAGNQVAAAKAAGNAAAAKDRAERIRKGEDVPGGLGKPLTREDMVRMLREKFGWTASDFRHMEAVTAIGALGDEAFEEFLSEITDSRARARREIAIARAFLRKRGVRPERSDDTEGGPR